jgi:hypothetical protein
MNVTLPMRLKDTVFGLAQQCVTDSAEREKDPVKMTHNAVTRVEYWVDWVVVHTPNAVQEVLGINPPLKEKVQSVSTEYHATVASRAHAESAVAAGHAATHPVSLDEFKTGLHEQMKIAGRQKAIQVGLPSLPE